jgi:nucleoside-diphosphate-sugar epimerase
LTHLEDAIGAIHQILLKKAFGEVYNVVSPMHPTKLQFYGRVIEQLGGVPNPVETDSAQAFKIVNSDKIQNQLEYQFKYYNPLEAL